MYRRKEQTKVIRVVHEVDVYTDCSWPAIKDEFNKVPNGARLMDIKDLGCIRDVQTKTQSFHWWRFMFIEEITGDNDDRKPTSS